MKYRRSGNATQIVRQGFKLSEHYVNLWKKNS